MKAASEAPQIYRERLAGKSSRHAVTELCGDDANSAKRLREFIVGLPTVWKLAYKETLPERKRRRAKLARQLKAAATTLAADPEYTNLSVTEISEHADQDYLIRFVDMRFSNRPSCADVVDMIADQVAAARSSDGLYLMSRRGMDLKPYCLLALHFRLACWPKFRGYRSRAEFKKDESGNSVLSEIETEKCERRRSPNRQIESLIGALLATSIKANTLTQLLGPNARRKYTKDSAQD